MRVFCIAAALAVLVLSGCSTKAPMSVGEFRDAYKKDFFLAKKTTLTVNRPYSKVYAEMGAYAKRCLNYKMTVTSTGAYGARSTSTTYFSAYTEQTSKGKGYLTIQSHAVAANMIKTSPEPEGGYYTFLADMKDKGGKTELIFYGAKIGSGDYFKALESVAKGEKTKICPGEG